MILELMRTAGPPPLAGVARAATTGDAVAGAELPVRVVRMFAEIA